MTLARTGAGFAPREGREIDLGERLLDQPPMIVLVERLSGHLLGGQNGEVGDLASDPLQRALGLELDVAAGGGDQLLAPLAAGGGCLGEGRLGGLAGTGDDLVGLVPSHPQPLAVVGEQLGELADTLAENRELQIFFFSPYFSSEEKREGIAKAISGAEDLLQNFLELLAEKHRMPAIFGIRRIFDELWAEEKERLEVTLTSAVELDQGLVKRIGSEIEKRTGREIDLATVIDDEVLGGLVLRVGNVVCDASLRSKLERLRREIAAA